MGLGCHWCGFLPESDCGRPPCTLLGPPHFRVLCSPNTMGFLIEWGMAEADDLGGPSGQHISGFSATPGSLSAQQTFPRHPPRLHEPPEEA